MGPCDLCLIRPQAPWKIKQVFESQVHKIIYLERNSGGHFLKKSNSEKDHIFPSDSKATVFYSNSSQIYYGIFHNRISILISPCVSLVHLLGGRERNNWILKNL